MAKIRVFSISHLDITVVLCHNKSEMNQIKLYMTQTIEVMEVEQFKSKSDLIYEDLSNQIRSGVYPAGTKLPRESLFARQHGVALLTLRSALARLEAEGLIARVPRSGTFVMNPASGKPRTILLRIEDYCGNPMREKYFNRNLILGVANSSYLCNWELKLSNCTEDLDKLKLRYRKGEYLGIIWDRPPADCFPVIEELGRLQVPQVCINRQAAGSLPLSCDYCEAIRLAMRFLRDIGHREIMLIDIDRNSPVFVDRRKEFLDQLRFSGVERPEECLLRLEYPPRDCWLAIAERFRRRPGITAAIVSHTHMDDFLRYVEEARIGIPGDLSVIQWGESDHHNLKNDMKFSTLTESRFAIGERAVELLKQLAEDSFRSCEPQLLTPQLVMRSSCALPRNMKFVTVAS